MKKTGKMIARLGGTFVALICIYMLLLAGSKWIPISWVWDNVADAAAVLEKEGTYPTPIFGDSSVFYDNYTDAIYLNSLVTRNSDNIFVDAILNSYTNFEGAQSPQEMLNAHMENAENLESAQYARYWAGYQVILKILFVFLNLGGMRKQLFCVIALLTVCVLRCLYCESGWRGAVPFLAATLWGMTLLNGMCLVYSADILQMLVNMLIVHGLYVRGALAGEKGDWCFFVFGSISFFANYFTFPLVTLGMPLVLCISVLMKNHAAGEIIKDVLRKSVLWAVAFGATLGVKLLLAYCVMGKETGINQAVGWLGREFSLKGRIYFTIIHTFTKITVAEWCWLLGGCAVLLALTFYRGKNSHVRFPAKKLLPMALVMCYPTIWYFCLVKHSFHGFTKWNLMVAIYAGYSICCMVVPERQKVAGRKYELF